MPTFGTSRHRGLTLHDSIAMQLSFDKVLLILSILISISGIVVFAINYLFHLKNKKTRLWKKAEGSITKSEPQTSKWKGDFDYERTYRADVQYCYEVEGKEYTSNRVFFGDMLFGSSKSLVDKRLSQYPVSKKVDVYFDPENHAESVLETGNIPSIVRNIGIGCAVLMLGVASAVTGMLLVVP